MNLIRKVFNKLTLTNPKSDQYSSLEPDIISAYNETRSPESIHLICHAPFKSIRFTQFGKATVCWKNERHILGEYPKNSIHEIWFGNKAEELRTHIRHNDLTLGCETCHTHLKKGEFLELRARDFDNKPYAEKRYPSFGEFVLGSACNLECIMCSGKYSSSIRKNREMKPLYPDPYDGLFLEQLEEFIPYFTDTYFFGGEPFYYGLHYQIWEKMIEMNPRCNITVQTNGTLLNDRIRRILDKGKFNIHLSIDSMNSENYEKIRVNGSFSKVMQNVRYFIDYCQKNNRKIRISVCPMRQNWQDIPHILEFCNKNDIMIKFNPTWFPPDCSLWNWDTENLTNILTNYKRVSFSAHSKIAEQNNQLFTGLIDQVHQWVHQSKSKPEESELDSFPAHILKEKLYHNIRTYFINENPYLGSSDFHSSEEFIRVLEEIFISIEDSRVFKKLLVMINSYPISYLVSEADANLKDVMVERFKLLTRKLPVSLISKNPNHSG